MPESQFPKDNNLDLRQQGWHPKTNQGQKLSFKINSYDQFPLRSILSSPITFFIGMIEVIDIERLSGHLTCTQRWCTIGLWMTSPDLVGKTYSMPVRVPSEIIVQVIGKPVSMTIVNTVKQVVSSSNMVKVSIGTSDQRRAQLRFPFAQVSLNQIWQAIKHRPQSFTHKLMLGSSSLCRFASATS